ncbi:MAG: energy transducer TonB [Methylococcales bacterium]|nr:energy transducer TonB [Methylococcales bacterium]
MPLSKPMHCNYLNIDQLQQQQKSRIVAIMLLMVVVTLHVSLALYLLNTPATETKKPAVLMEVAMLSTLGSAEKKQVTEVAPSPPVKKEPIKPKPVVKPVKPLKKPTLIKKPAPQPVEIKEAIPVPKFVPGPSAPASTPVAAPSASASSTSMVNAKTTKAAGSGQDDSKTVVSGVVPLFRVSPDYPQRLKNRHIEGWVKVEFTIQTDGSVDKAEVVSSEPEDIFDEVALDAINQWKFKEKIVNGVAVTQRAVQRFTFQLTQ